MPGATITDQQYGLYMSARRLGATQKVAGAKAGLCERTGRTLEKQKCKPSQRPTRGRKPGNHTFADVWDHVIVPLIKESPFLSGTILLEHLQDLYPGQYGAPNLRTLQRLLQQWKALHGPEKEVIFRQEHQPGLQGLSDFTTPKTFSITIQGKPFEHILYHFRLAYSNWSNMSVVQGGESFIALSKGLQDALWRLGGCPTEHRTDSLSAAYKNLSSKAEDDFTQRYKELCHHYGIEATRNNPGVSHENGSIESPHGHLKRRIAQGLALRGSCNFESIQSYQQFIDAVVNRHNQRHKKQIDEERQYLKPLPSYRTIDFEETTARVTTSSTIVVKNVVYSVPSRLIGQQLHIHMYEDRLACYFGHEYAFDLTRMKAIAGRRQYCIDYRHLIVSLARKPQAFRYSILRDDLLPSPVYQEIWKRIDVLCISRHACKLMVGILKIAADHECEEELGKIVVSILRKGQVPSLGMLQNKYGVSKNCNVPKLSIPQHALSAYNRLLPAFMKGRASCVNLLNCLFF